MPPLAPVMHTVSFMGMSGYVLNVINQPGFPEYSKENAGIAVNGSWSPDGRSLSLRRLRFPNYEDWDLEFAGSAGANNRRSGERHSRECIRFYGSLLEP
jgi:hypothetical protein